MTEQEIKNFLDQHYVRFVSRSSGLKTTETVSFSTFVALVEEVERLAKQSQAVQPADVTETDALLIVALSALNEIPRKKLFSFDSFKDSYAVASAGDKWFRNKFGKDADRSIINQTVENILSKPLEERVNEKLQGTIDALQKRIR